MKENMITIKNGLEKDIIHKIKLMLKYKMVVEKGKNIMIMET